MRLFVFAVRVPFHAGLARTVEQPTPPANPTNGPLMLFPNEAEDSLNVAHGKVRGLLSLRFE